MSKNVEKILEGYATGKDIKGLDDNLPKSSGYWQVWENVERRAKDIIDERGELPGAETLRKTGETSLVCGVIRHHGGMNAVREKLGLEKYEPKYKSKKELRKGLMLLWKDHTGFEGRIPPENWMRKNGYTSLCSAITHYHGGWKKVREEFGIKPWKKFRNIDLGDWDIYLGEIDKLFENHPELDSKLPGRKWMREHEYFPLVQAAHKYHGGIRDVRNRIGQFQLRRAKGYLQQINNVKTEITRIINDNNKLKEGILPSSEWLKDHGHSSIVHAICTYHGGMSKVAKELNFRERQKPNGYWENLVNRVEEARQFLEQNSEYSSFPGGWTVRKKGYTSLAGAVHRLHPGGFPAFRRLVDRCREVGWEKEEVSQILRNYSDETTSEQRIDVEDVLVGYAGGQNA
jgi:hypothetical protein